MVLHKVAWPGAPSFRFQRGARPRAKSKQGTADKFLVYFDKNDADEKSETEGNIETTVPVS